MEFAKRNSPWVVAVVLMLLIAVWVQNRPPSAEVVHPRRESLAELLTVSGQVHGVEESRLAPEVAGTVEKILVAEGEPVKAGQLVARLDTSKLQAQVEQARQKVKVASAQLEVASRPPLPSEFQEVRSEVERAEKVAQANLESARQKLLEAQRGPRDEQVRRAQAELKRLEADSAQKLRDQSRQKELFQKGAISKQAYEQSTTLVEQAQAAKQQAEQQLLELKRGTRAEELAQAREAVRAAEAEVQAAGRTGEARLQQLREKPRPEDIRLAQAQLEDAKAGLQVAKQQLDQAQVKAPYDGVVGRRLLRAGDPAGPSAPILTFSSQPALEIRVEIDESERSRVEPGMKARVKAAGYPEPFEATVRDTAAEIDSLKGTLEVRLVPDTVPEWLLPGQTVDVNIIVSPEGEKLLVPLTSVKLDGDGSKALVVVGGRVEEKEIKVSSPSRKGYLVLDGLTPEDLVVQYPQGFQDGQRVRTEDGSFP